MAQINLLKQKRPFDNVLFTLPSIAAKLLAVGVLLLLVFYGWQFVKIGRLEAQMRDEQQGIAAAEQQVNSIRNRDELYTRQGQLQQFKALLDKHVYWSALFPALARATLKQAAYSKISVTQEGELTLSVSVPDLIALDKFIQVFDHPEFNQNFYNLRVGAFRKLDQKDQQGYVFEVRLNFNKALLHPQAAVAQGGK